MADQDGAQPAGFQPLLQAGQGAAPPVQQERRAATLDQVGRAGTARRREGSGAPENRELQREPSTT